MDMRALYYVAMLVGNTDGARGEELANAVKANENCLNQNFTIIAQKMNEIEARLGAVENALN